MSAGIYYLIFMLTVSGAIAAYNLVPIVRQHFRSQRVITEGVLATARVIELKDTGNRVNGQPVAAIRLEVSPAGAAPFEATARSVVTAINMLQFVPGKTVQVKYDPAHKSDVVVVGPGP